MDEIKIEEFQGRANKERLSACTYGQKTERVPNWEILVEDEHIEKYLGCKNGDTMGVAEDSAQGRKAAERIRPICPGDYIELCQIIGQDAITMDAFWTAIKIKKPDGTVALWNDRSFRTGVCRQQKWDRSGDLVRGRLGVLTCSS